LFVVPVTWFKVDGSKSLVKLVPVVVQALNWYPGQPIAVDVYVEFWNTWIVVVAVYEIPSYRTSQVPLSMIIVK
jgi:hypothetical protein